MHQAELKGFDDREPLLDENGRVALPNVRKIFVPDPGYIIFDADLSGADAQVVAWEADDEDLKSAFRSGLKIHEKNAEDMLGREYTQADPTTRTKLYKEMKGFVHATNYGASARTVAISFGWTVKTAEERQRRWFSAHPGIRRWHQQIETRLNSPSKTIRNAFGYHRVFFDRPRQSFAEAVNWIPQSTVALNTFFGAEQLEAAMPKVEILLQVHDSLVFQIPEQSAYKHQSILDGLTVSVPYDDPLTIPWGLTKSAVSWGDCVPVAV